jgi:hypothetical protein
VGCAGSTNNTTTGKRDPAQPEIIATSLVELALTVKTRS